MKTYAAMLDCPNGHHIITSIFDAEGEHDEAAFEAEFRAVMRQTAKEIAAGELAPLCPFCGADFTRNGVIYASESKISREQIEAKLAAMEPDNIERAKQAQRRRMN